MLSPATEVIDRREKLIAYRSLPSLRDYLLIAQDCRRVEWYQRDAAGDWRHAIVEDGTLSFVFGDVSVKFTVADLYEDVVLEN